MEVKFIFDKAPKEYAKQTARVAEKEREREIEDGVSHVTMAKMSLSNEACAVATMVYRISIKVRCAEMITNTFRRFARPRVLS